MLYKEFKNTHDYRAAHVVDLFWEETGKDIPANYPEMELDAMEVAHFSKDAGWLSISLKGSHNRKLTVTSGNSTFELVDVVPLGFVMWNIGKNAPKGCVPFCRVIPGTNNVEADTLKAIRIGEDAARKVMMALGNGCNTLEKMEKFIRRHKNAPDDSWEYRKVQRIQEALPIVKSFWRY